MTIEIIKNKAFDWVQTQNTKYDWAFLNVIDDNCNLLAIDCDIDEETHIDDDIDIAEYLLEHDAIYRYTHNETFRDYDYCQVEKLLENFCDYIC